MSSKPVTTLLARRAPPSAPRAIPGQHMARETVPIADLRSMRELHPKDRTTLLKEQLQIQKEDLFLDIGCGRGNVLLDALDLGCSIAIGVEFNPGCKAMLERILADSEKQKKWCTTVARGIGGGGTVYYLRHITSKRAATLYFVIGDLLDLTWETLTSRCPKLSTQLTTTWRVYWYGTVMNAAVKKNVCERMLNHMPNGTRAVYVHLPHGQYASGGKTRDPLFQYGLAKGDSNGWMLRRLARDRCDYLLTTTSEEVVGFLYTKSSDTACHVCGGMDHKEWKRSGKRCPDGRVGSSLAQSNRKKRRDAVLTARREEVLASAEAFAVLRSEVLPQFEGRLTKEMFDFHEDESDQAMHDDEHDEMVEESDDDEMEDDDLMSSGSEYMSDEEPRDPDLTFRHRMAKRARVVRGQPPTTEEAKSKTIALEEAIQHAVIEYPPQGLGIEDSSGGGGRFGVSGARIPFRRRRIGAFSALNPPIW